MKTGRGHVRICNRGSLLLLSFSLGMVIAGCGSDSAVEAREAEPVVNFDGEKCSYEGPSAITAGGIEFTLANSSDHNVGLVAIHFEDVEQFEAAIEEFPVGAAKEPEGDEFPDGVSLQMNMQSEPGAEAQTLGAFEPGSYVLDCYTRAATGPDWLWRAGTFEIVESG